MQNKSANISGLNAFIFPSIPTIEQVVAFEYGMKVHQLYWRTRIVMIKEARQICMWWRTRNTRATFEEIGSRYAGPGNEGGFDHATVGYARDTIYKLMESDPNFKAKVNRISKNTDFLINRSSKWLRMKHLLENIDQQLTVLDYLFNSIEDKQGFEALYEVLHSNIKTASSTMADGVGNNIEKAEQKRSNFLVKKYKTSI